MNETKLFMNEENGFVMLIYLVAVDHLFIESGCASNASLRI